VLERVEFVQEECTMTKTSHATREPTAAEREELGKLNAAMTRMLRHALADMAGRPPPTRAPSYRYFQLGQVQYCWNTTPVENEEEAGRWFAWEYRPVGRGSRTGGARRFEMRHRVKAGSRKAARAKALGWYLRAKGLRDTIAAGGGR
jgi:hypothetical protein